MKIRDRMSGRWLDGEFISAEECADDQGCPTCGAESTQQCSVEDPERPGFGIELGPYAHAARSPVVRTNDDAARTYHEARRPEPAGT